MRFREATGPDATTVAALHAESWRNHYRGAYRDEYLDGDVVEDRLRVWRERLSMPAPNQFVVLAFEGDNLIGFLRRQPEEPISILNVGSDPSLFAVDDVIEHWYVSNRDFLFESSFRLSPTPGGLQTRSSSSAFSPR